MSDLLSFYVIWNTLKFKENLEDAHKEYLKIHEKQQLIIEAEIKILNTYKTKLLSFSKTGEEVPTEETSFETWKSLNHFIEEVEDYCEPLILRTSQKLLQAKTDFENSHEDFVVTENKIKSAAKAAFDGAVIEKFQGWRMDEIQKLRERINRKMQISADAKYSVLVNERRKFLQESETISNLQQEVTELQQKLYKQPLDAKHRINVYDDELFQLRETAKILQKQIKIAQKSTDESLSRSTSRKTSKDTHRTKQSDGMRRRPTIYEQIFKGEQKRIEKQETRSTTTDDA